MSVIRKAFVATTATVALVLALAGCGSSAAPVATQPSDGEGGGATQALRVGIYPGQAFMIPLLYAERTGMFDKAGVDVELITLASGPDQVAALANGTTDAFVFTGGGAMVTTAKGQPLIATTGIADTQIYAVLAQKGLERPNAAKPFPENMLDLKGKTIGVTARGSDDENVMRTLVAAAGLNPDTDVTFLPGGNVQQRIAGFKAKQFDYMPMVDPGISILTKVDGIADTVVDLRQDFAGNPFTPWIGQAVWTKPATAESRKAAFDAFNTAVDNAITEITAPGMTDKIAEVLASDFPIDSTTFKLVIDNTLPTFSSKVTCDAVANTGTWAVGMNMLEADKVPTCADFVWGAA